MKLSKKSKYRSISQLRNIVGDIKFEYSGTVDPVTKEVVYDQSVKLPTLDFVGTVKIHGTNRSIWIDPNGAMTCSSKKVILDDDYDSYGFFKFISTKIHTNELINLNARVRQDFDIPDVPIAVYGEWAGGSIQKGVAVNELEKQFYIFDIKVLVDSSYTIDENHNDDDNNTPNYWLDLSNYDMKFSGEGIFDVKTFGTYRASIDFSNLKENQVLSEIADSVDKIGTQCPVGKYFNVDGHGEGIVWKHYKRNGTVLCFKTKDSRHESSKTKNRAPEIEPEKLESITKFIEYAVTENRLEQMAIETIGCVSYEDGMIVDLLDFDRKNIGKFIKAVFDDVVKEESDVLTVSGLTSKDVSKAISVKSKEWFFDKEQSF